MNSALDLDGDGEFNLEGDGKVIYDRVVEVLEYNLPAGSGFGAGFVMGLRSG